MQTSLAEFPVKLLGFFPVSQPPFAALPGFCVHKSNLLEARMIVTTYNQHVRLLSSEPFVGLRLQSLLGPGSRHCYGIITLKTPRQGVNECYRLWVLKKSLFISNGKNL